MSHFTTIKTQIRDIEALKLACSEIGLHVLANTDARGYVGNVTHGEYVIKCAGPYDIAVNKQADGTYGLATDWYCGHVAKQVGENYKRLIQLYGVHKATIEARKKGLNVSRSMLANGSVRLVIQGATL